MNREMRRGDGAVTPKRAQVQDKGAHMEYGFEWDPEKAQANRRKHGVSFEEAATAFRDPQMLTIYNGEHSNAEERWITLGISAVGRLVVVCHAFRKESVESATIRVFSARKATKNENRQYRE